MAAWRYPGVRDHRPERLRGRGCCRGERGATARSASPPSDRPTDRISPDHHRNSRWLSGAPFPAGLGLIATVVAVGALILVTMARATVGALCSLGLSADARSPTPGATRSRPRTCATGAGLPCGRGPRHGRVGAGRGPRRLRTARSSAGPRPRRLTHRSRGFRRRAQRTDTT